MPIWGGQTNDTVAGDGDDDLVHGAGGNDTVEGRKGADTLYGDTGDDKVKGADGDDVLEGNGGRDILTGGDGVNQFGLRNLNDVDKITDFKPGTDKIVLAASVFDVFGDTLGKNEFRLAGEGGEGDDASIVYRSGTGELLFAPGDGVRLVAVAQLDKGLGLSHGDFLMG